MFLDGLMDRRFNIAVGKLLKNKMDEKFYVSNKAARLLKEKGYNEETDYTIDNKGRIWPIILTKWMGKHKDECVFPCPTKSEVIDWLDRKIKISIRYYDLTSKWHYDITPVRPGTKIINSLSFSTRLEAEEAAIIDALENL